LQLIIPLFQQFDLEVQKGSDKNIIQIQITGVLLIRNTRSLEQISNHWNLNTVLSVMNKLMLACLL